FPDVSIPCSTTRSLCLCSANKSSCRSVSLSVSFSLLAFVASLSPGASLVSSGSNSRRSTFLPGFTCSFFIVKRCYNASVTTHSRFPLADRPRLWGTAVSHYQIEGHDPCDWSEWERSGHTRGGACGGAVGAWERYEDDADLARDAGA